MKYFIVIPLLTEMAPLNGLRKLNSSENYIEQAKNVHKSQ